MSDTKDFEELKELIDSFAAYRNVLAPLQESLRAIGETYDGIKYDLENLSRSFSGNVISQLDKVHQTLNSQAKSGAELGKKIEDYAQSGEKYTAAVSDMTKRFEDVAKRIDAISSIELDTESLVAKLDAVISDKRTSYNLPQLQKSLDAYNKNIEKITEFINKDIADVLQDNAQKIEAIRRDNEALAAAVAAQGRTIADLTAAFRETSELLKNAVEGNAVNEAYLFDAFDKWAADRKVKIKTKDQ